MRKILLMVLFFSIVANLCFANKEVKFSDVNLVESYKVVAHKKGFDSGIAIFYADLLQKRYSKNNPSKALFLGIIQIKNAQNDYASCMVAADKLIELSMSDKDGYFWKGYILEQQAKYSMALKEYQKALSFNAVDWSTNYHIATIYNDLTNDSEGKNKSINRLHAIEYYAICKDLYLNDRNLLVIDEDIIEVLNNLGRLYILNDEYVEAIHCYDLILKDFNIDDNRKCAFYGQKGLVYLLMEKPKQAKKMLNQIRKINQNATAGDILERVIKDCGIQ